MQPVDTERFEELVRDAVDALPENFRAQIANVDFGIEDWARPEDYARTRTSPNAMLLGVYRGIPLTRRGAHYNLALPDTIIIFQQPLERLARDEADLADRVHHVVRHEVAHYFGISDARLRELDAY